MNNINDFRDKYGELTQVLVCFLEAIYDNVFDENIVINDYYYNPDISKGEMTEEAKKAVKQAQEVLQLNPFPEALISDLTNRTHPNITRKEWLEKVVLKLQERINEFEKENNQ